MKKLSLLLCMSALVMASFAQLPNGTYAPAFTGYEINKTTGSIVTNNPITLYDLTDAGYTVYMDVFATWCNPCWNFHTGGHLENLYSQYGPTGTNEVRVLAIEGSYGNYASLSGTGPDAGGQATQGNWLNGVEYPVIPLRMSPNTTQFDNDYAISYFPTVYMVCPNRLVYEVGQQTTANLYAAKSTCPQYDNTLDNNALLLKTEGFDGAYYCSCTANPTVTLQNVGNNPLTSATLTIDFDGQTSTFNWSGNLAKYNVVSIDLPQITSNVDGMHTYTVTINTVNGAADADPAMNTSSTEFAVNINPTSTTIDENFSEGIPDDWSNAEGILFTHELDGNHGNAVVFNAYNYESGTIANLYLPYENLSTINNPVLSFDLAHKRYNSNYSERLRVMCSTNCGASWTNLYSKSGNNLATAGTTTSNYIPVDADWRNETVDLSGITDNDDVIIRFEFKSGYGNNVWIDNVKLAGATGIDENNELGVSIYPNPATDMISITTSENIQRVEIFNMQGQLVKAESGAVNNISVKDLANGLYTLKLTTDNGTSIHKIIKK